MSALRRKTAHRMAYAIWVATCPNGSKMGSISAIKTALQMAAKTLLERPRLVRDIIPVFSVAVAGLSQPPSAALAVAAKLRRKR